MFEKVTVWAALGTPSCCEKTRVDALSETDPPTPAPFRVTICGDPATESAKLNAAVRAPDAVGENVTETVQLAPTVKTDPHVIAMMRKSEDSEPASQMLEMFVSLPPPGFESVTV